MKFVADGYDIQDAINKALVICPKNPPVAIMSCIYISAVDGHNVTVCAVGPANYIKTYIRADVIENGAVIVSRGDIEKVYNMDRMVTVEAKNDVLQVSNGKKSRMVKVSMMDATNIAQSVFPHWEECINGFDNKFLTCNCGEFLTALDKLKDFPANSEAYQKNHPECCGFHLNGDRHMIEACNGYVAAWKRIEGDWNSSEGIVINYSVLAQLKKIANTKADKRDNVSVFLGKRGDMKSVQISGENYDYYTILIEKTFLNLKNSISPWDYNYIVHADADKLYDIADDYIRCDKDTVQQNKKPVYMVADYKYGLYMAMNSMNFRAIEEVEGAVITNHEDDRLLVSVNPEYIKIVMTFFKKDNVHILMRNENSPVIIMTGDDYYDADDLAFILPTRQHDSHTINSMTDDLISGR